MANVSIHQNKNSMGCQTGQSLLGKQTTKVKNILLRDQNCLSLRTVPSPLILQAANKATPFQAPTTFPRVWSSSGIIRARSGTSCLLDQGRGSDWFQYHCWYFCPENVVYSFWPASEQLPIALISFSRWYLDFWIANKLSSYYLPLVI